MNDYETFNNGHSGWPLIAPKGKTGLLRRILDNFALIVLTS